MFLHGTVMNVKLPRFEYSFYHFHEKPPDETVRGVQIKYMVNNNFLWSKSQLKC